MPPAEAISGPIARASQRLLLEQVHTRRDPRAREEIIRRGMKLVHHVARRYDRRGVEYEELVQIGSVGLINAVDRFDPGRGTQFSTFAVPHIAGEIRKYFRDRVWAVRVGRAQQERHALIGKVSDRLLVRLQRYPTLKEIAAEAELTLDEVLEALQAGRQFTTDSLDSAMQAGGEETGTLHEFVGQDDLEFDRVDVRLTTAVAMQHLQRRERMILQLRFEDELKQSEIAQRLGISQMHVSRLLTQTMQQLRTVIDSEQDQDQAA